MYSGHVSLYEKKKKKLYTIICPTKEPLTKLVNCHHWSFKWMNETYDYDEKNCWS
jgi:hypothetical protein